jgi:4-amino-4-deoxy-L-arabinose transferase-like glycosyltransferase
MSDMPSAISNPQSKTNNLPIRQRLRTLLWLVNSLFWCLLGQYYLSNLPQFRWDGAIFYAIGVFSFWRVLTRVGVSTSPVSHPKDAAFEPISQRGLLLFVSVALAALAYWSCAHNTFTRLGVMAWLGAVALFLVALWPRTPTPSRALPLSGGGLGGGLTIRLRWRTVALIAIILVAAFFRLYRLQEIPPEMTSDHIEKLLDIYDLSHGVRPIYFERNTGREPFQFYWAFTVMRVFNTGITFYGLKLANALIGILTIYGIYLLGRELAGEDVGLLAAFFASVMQWAESITRIGLRFPYAALAATFALWAFLRALRTGRRADYLIAGLIFGAGFYGYTAYRVMPIVVAVLVLVKLLIEQPHSWQAWRQLVLNLTVFTWIAIIVFVPLGRYWHDNPQMFWQRSATRIEGDYGVTAHNIGWTLANNTLRALGMFNVVGDTVWANTLPNKPTLDKVGGVFLVLGVMAALYRLFKRRDWPLLMAILAGVTLLLPSILSVAFPGENPSVVRTAGAIPIVAALVGLGLYVVARAAKEMVGTRWGMWLAVPLLALILAATTLINYRRYFVDYYHSYQLSSQNSTEMAQAMRDFIASGGDLSHIVIHAWPYWVDTRALAILMGKPDWQNTNVVLDRVTDLERMRDDPAPQMYLLHPSDAQSLQILKETFPQGNTVRKVSQIPGHDFILFLVPRR